MSNMKCPFCNRNLHKGEDGIYSHLDYMTECKGRLFDGSKALWQELTRTRKALEIAVDGVKYMRNNCLEYAADYMDKADEILEQITATLENQKE